MYLFVLCLLFISIAAPCNGNYTLRRSCSKASLFAYVQDSSVLSTMSISGTYSLTLDPNNSDNLLPNSFVPMQCNDGYVLASGQLNITCVDDAWTPFPICNLDPNSNAATTPTCTIDPTSIFNITNGYAASYSLTYTSNTTVTGNYIQFACDIGYALDSNIGAFYICDNGQWSTKPQCLSMFNIFLYLTCMNIDFMKLHLAAHCRH